MSQLIKKKGKHALVTVVIANKVNFSVRDKQLSNLRRFVTTE